MSTDFTGISGSGSVVAALQKASAATGSDFGYLLKTAMRESGLNASARAPTSSASGLFQFVDQTWLAMVKKYGAKYGLGKYADSITKGSDGRYHADSSDRQTILNLKQNPEISALMAGEYAGQCKGQMECDLGRSVSSDELYAAHFLGAEGASKLIRMKEETPSAPAAAAFPQAAAANRSVFYNADGSAKSASEVYAWATHNSASSGKAVTVSGLPDLATQENGEIRAGNYPALAEYQMRMLATVLLSDGKQQVSGLSGLTGQSSSPSLSLSYDLLRLLSDDSDLANGIKNT